MGPASSFLNIKLPIMQLYCTIYKNHSVESSSILTNMNLGIAEHSGWQTNLWGHRGRNNTDCILESLDAPKIGTITDRTT